MGSEGGGWISRRSKKRVTDSKCWYEALTCFSNRGACAGAKVAEIKATTMLLSRARALSFFLSLSLSVCISVSPFWQIRWRGGPCRVVAARLGWKWSEGPGASARIAVGIGLIEDHRTPGRVLADGQCAQDETVGTV